MGFLVDNRSRPMIQILLRNAALSLAFDFQSTASLINFQHNRGVAEDTTETQGGPEFQCCLDPTIRDNDMKRGIHH